MVDDVPNLGSSKSVDNSTIAEVDAEAVTVAGEAEVSTEKASDGAASVEEAVAVEAPAGTLYVRKYLRVAVALFAAVALLSVTVAGT